MRVDAPTRRLSPSRHLTHGLAVRPTAVGTLAGIVPIAVVALDFEPFLRVGDRIVLLETLGIAGAIAVALFLAAWLGSRPPSGDGEGAYPVAGVRRPDGGVLRPDDLLLIVLAAIPGALAGGRLGYVLIHLGYYAASPGAILDPRQGSLELSLAVVGGALTGVAAARLLGEPVGRWLGVAALPVLVAIAGGKVAMALGGSGQGAPSDVSWATMYLGPGPWGSLAPDVPSHPAQLYEALATVAALGVAIAYGRTNPSAARDGRLFVAALGVWAVARTLVAATWRDPTVLGPLRADQLLTIAIALGCAVILFGRRFWRRAERQAMAGDSAGRSIVERPGGEDPDGEAARSR